MSVLSSIPYVENDRLPHLSVSWKLQDITGYTLTLRLKRPDGTIIERTAVIDEANAGNAVGAANFHFEWAAGDLQKGFSHGEIEVVDGAGLNQTFTGLVFDVAPEIC